MKKTLPSLFLLFIFSLQQLQACAVPVFRYALERWPPDAFYVTLLHKGMEEEAQEKWLAPVFDANYGVSSVDLREDELPEGIPDAYHQIAKQVSEQQPYFALEYPEDYGIEEPVIFQGPTSPENMQQLLSSPVREELIKRILGGHSTVFLFIPGKNAENNSSLLQLLEEQSVWLNENLELPEKMLEIYSPEQKAEVIKELPIHFSVMTLYREDPKEGVLVESLKRIISEEEWNNPDLAWVVPIFGQGRALAMESSETFSKDMMREMAVFLCGSCSCEVKELNPGFDVFIVEPWMEDLERSFVDEAKEPPELFNPLAYEIETDSELVAELPPPGEEPPSAASSEETAELDATPPLVVQENNVSASLLVLIGGLVVLLGGGAVFLKGSRGGDA